MGSKIVEDLARLKKQGKRFGVVLIDAPNPYKVWDEETGSDRAPPYETMTLDAIKALDLQSVMLPDCAVFQWITNPLAVLGVHAENFIAWGCKPSSVAFTWAKTTKSGKAWAFGLGRAGTRQNTETCYLGRHGAPKRLHADVPELMVAPVRDHSRKPDMQYPRIERLFAGPYLECFARHRRKDWTCIGDQVDRFK